MKRIFIAVKVTAGNTLLKLFSSLKGKLSVEIIKWTTIDNMHITLAFPGNTSEEKIERIDELLKVRCSDFKKFEVVMRGTGVFKSFSDPRIIWAGFEKSEELTKLAKTIQEGLRGIGIELEERPFNPHLTLARIKNLSDREAFERLISQYQNIDIQVVPVNEVILYESIHAPVGPVYKPLKIYAL